MVGFIIYQFGISVIALPGGYLSEVESSIFAALFPGQSVDLLAVFLQFGGGIIAILGLIMAISGVAAPQRIETRYVQAPVEASSNRTQLFPLLPSRKFNCKFCGAEIEENELFCPKCRKAQK
jgi:hypothetical protein